MDARTLVRSINVRVIWTSNIAYANGGMIISVFIYCISVDEVMEYEQVYNHTTPKDNQEACFPQFVVRRYHSHRSARPAPA